MIRRINFFSGPCCGKSVIASKVFNTFKCRGDNIELIQEYAKELVYDGAKIDPYTQLIIFSEQLKREYRVLNSDPDIKIVTDSPIMLSIAYAQKYGFNCCEELITIAKRFELEYPSINFFLLRGDCPYCQKGRIEDEDAAKYMDMRIERFLADNSIDCIFMPYNDHEEILQNLEDLL